MSSAPLRLRCFILRKYNIEIYTCTKILSLYIFPAEDIESSTQITFIINYPIEPYTYGINNIMKKKNKKCIWIHNISAKEIPTGYDLWILLFIIGAFSAGKLSRSFFLVIIIALSITPESFVSAMNCSPWNNIVKPCHWWMKVELH